ncbi:MAG: SDR family NAD(P)-dependent oxidoreductase [Bacteriovorax sp.]|nr:SDR family NAD(P)-dependent oxidoreductase [Bacteriovorax sp.]
MNIFITGGTTGIGLSLAKLYLEEGHRVGICARNLEKFPVEIKNKYKQLKCYQVNVVNREELRAAMFDFANGELDIVVANAGRSVGAKSKTPQFSVANDIIDINVKGVLNTFEFALEIMLPKKKGHLVATASVAGFMGLPGAGAYSASKAAVLKLCESYSIDLKRSGIAVTAIAPGFIDTPLTQQNNHKMPFLMSSEKAAKLIKRALEKKKALYIFPFRMKIIVAILEKMPRSWYRSLMGMKMFNYSSED